MPEDFLIVEGKKFLLLKRASVLFGYSADYLGELCRGGKVSARKLYGQWYVEEASIFAYLEESREKNLKRRQELSFHLSRQLGKFPYAQTPKDTPPTRRRFREKFALPLASKILRGVSVATLAGTLFFGQTPTALAILESSNSSPLVLKVANFWVQEIGSILKETAEVFAQATLTLADDLRDSVGGAMGSLGDTVKGVTAATKEAPLAFADLAVSASESGRSLVQTLRDVGVSLAEASSNSLNTLGESLLYASEEMVALVEKTPSVLQRAGLSIGEAGGSLILALEDTGNSLVRSAPIWLNETKEGLSAVVQKSSEGLASAVALVKNPPAVSLEDFYLSLGAATEDLLSYAGEIRERVVAATPLQNSFSFLAFSFGDALNSVFERVTTTIGEAVGNSVIFDSSLPAPAIEEMGTTSLTSTETSPQAPSTAKTSPERIIERVIERIVRVEVPLAQASTEGTLASAASLDLRLEQIRNQLMSEIARFSGQSSAQITNVYTTLGQASRIDRLTSTVITSPTISSASISGATLSGSIAASEATLSLGTLTLGSATTTSSNGFNISTGCFAVNSVCLAGAGEGTVGQIAFYSVAGTTLAPTSTIFLTQGGLFGVGTTSPFAKFAVNPIAGNVNQFVVGSSTATSLLIDGAGKVGIGTTSPAQNFSVLGNGYFTGGLGIGIATTSAGVLQTSSNAYFGGNLYVGGNSTVIGASSANSLAVNSSIASNFVPDTNSTRNLGSASFYWGNAYVNILNANNIVAANTQIGGTQAADFTINSDNATSDTENMNLIFYRGTLGPNSLLTWNSAASAKRFEFNQNLFVQNASTSTDNATLLVKGSSLQNSDIFQVASSSGSIYFNVTSKGNIGIGTSSPFARLSVAAVDGSSTSTTLFQISSSTAASVSSSFFTVLNTGNIGVGTSSPFARFAINPLAGDTNQFVVGSSTATSFIINPAGNVGIGLTAPATKLDVFEANAAAQLRLSKSASFYSELTVDSTGDLQVSAAGGDIRALTENLWICDGGSCPTLTATSTAGNIFVENAAVFGNGFSFRPITVNELGLYNASSSLLMVFDQVQ